MADNLNRAYRNSCRRYRLPMSHSSSLPVLKNACKTNAKRDDHSQLIDESMDAGREAKDTSIDLPDDFHVMNGNESSNDSEYSSHFQQSEESSSDYEDFSSIIRKRPKPKVSCHLACRFQSVSINCSSSYS